MTSEESVLFVDVHEPIEGEAMLRQAVPNVVRASLNTSGYADYFWTNPDGSRKQWERKQTGECLADLDSVEEQLNRELATCDELTLVVEGVAKPIADGIQVYKLSENGRFFAPHYKLDRQSYLWQRYLSWKWSLFHVAGVVVVETATLEATMGAVATDYKQSKVAEHSTMRRYTQPHIPPFSPNVHVENLYRLKGCGIGPERAQKLVEKYGTFWKAVSAPKEELYRELGLRVTMKFLDTLGRGQEDE